MSQEFRDVPSFQPWGPFISPNYHNEPITLSDMIIASVVYILTLVNVGIAIWLGIDQTHTSRSPLRSAYVWMIWLELVVSTVMGTECYLHIHKIIKPSFAFYFTILFWWCIQVQLLLQIIINRIRVIVPDRRKSKHIMIATATVVTMINISVFCIWIPARLQVSKSYELVNEIWDRCEKVIYLLIDAALNWYFLKVVKANLINNGLQKYDRLFKYNQRIIVLSLLMDVMIIAAMSIPNSFVYIQFHPLAYLVKLNIEMTMANLIKRIAISTSRRQGNVSIAHEFVSASTSDRYNTNPSGTGRRRASVIELSSQISASGKRTSDRNDRAVSFTVQGNQIKKTEEIHISSEPADGANFDGLGYAKETALRVREVHQSKSLDDVTEGGESVKSDAEGRGRESSDDEAVLVVPKKGHGGWGRLRD
ncbi:hypothetical protein BU24DRAFT_400921 [Aaosphaeria arxii CBS 175.79]|uniref:Integral membrane protein n=1 Tax=Aaosphaeria arxii CBS 175.79 TaxID=1450172 RepID=A0A6A5XB70_9PLEO|nr:uncharacterized protein BU24DRAFT_400921 [Aaosphaeria arxii CBS 175.79]KAF2010181.1 hypothetical protein BU24DRAFT_400921 [Aaosphaeria arxii CBS 175.79]